jgi:hypothetical protein
MASTPEHYCAYWHVEILCNAGRSTSEIIGAVPDPHNNLHNIESRIFPKQSQIFQKIWM